MALRIIPIPIPTPFPVGPVNAYLIRGASTTLVDTGPRTPEAVTAVTEALGREGLRESDIDAIMLTHGHADHVGLAAHLRRAGAGPVCVHPLDRPPVEDPGGPHDQSVPMYAEVARQHGMPADLVADTMQFYRHILSVMEGTPAQDLPPDGEVVLGGDLFRVIDTPGHSSGSVCYFHESTGQLLSGDTVLPAISTNAFFRGPVEDSRLGLSWFRRSLARVAELAPRRIYPGHGPPFHDAGRVLAALQEAHRERQGEIEALLRESEPLCAYEISTRLFPHVEREGRWLAFAEVLGQLEVMEEDGRVRPEDDVWHMA